MQIRQGEIPQPCMYSVCSNKPEGTSPTSGHARTCKRQQLVLDDLRLKPHRPRPKIASPVLLGILLGEVQEERRETRSVLRIFNFQTISKFDIWHVSTLRSMQLSLPARSS